MAYAYNRIPYSNEKELHNMDEFSKYHDEQHNPDAKKYMLYDSTYIKLKIGQNQSTVIQIRTVVFYRSQEMTWKAGREASRVLIMFYILIWWWLKG